MPIIPFRIPYESVDEDQHSSLGVFCGFHISINSYSPSLILTGLSIVSSFSKRREFGSEEEDINTAECMDLVEVIYNV